MNFSFPRSLRLRITMALAAMTVMLVLVAVVASTSLRRLGGAIDVLLRENYASVIACGDMKNALERQDEALVLLAAGHEALVPSLLQQQQERFARAFEREARNITLPGEGSRVQSLGALQQTYRAEVQSLLQTPAVRREAAEYERLRGQLRSMLLLVEQIAQMNQAHMEQSDRIARASAQRSDRWTMLVSLLSVLLAVMFALTLPRALLRPLEALAGAVRALGEGNWDLSVPAPEAQELEPLVAAFERMVAQLQAYRKSSLGELLAAKDLARTTVACMQDPVVVFAQDGAVLLTNDAAERAFGLRDGSLEELRVAGCVIPPAMEALVQSVRQQKAPAGNTNLSEAMRWGAGESERFYLLRAAPLQDEASKSLRVIVVAQEVTRLRRIDELKSDMVATVSHEFKTPLTSLRMATHMLLEPGLGTLNEAQRELVTTAKTDTERLHSMVDELLDLVRIEAEAGALRRGVVEVQSLFQEVIDAHRSLAREKAITVTMEVAAEVNTFLADREKLGIVLANLLANALRHTPEQGRVWLSAERTNTEVRLVVRDTGEGMDEETASKIFSRPRVKKGSPTQGHGLGLTIAREIALQHGGDLRVESKRGEGSMFLVSLPLME